MTALLTFAVCFTVITFCMWVIEEYDRMRENARATRRREREAEQEEHYRRHYESIQADAVEDLRWELDLYGVQSFLWLDEMKRGEEE